MRIAQHWGLNSVELMQIYQEKTTQQSAKSALARLRERGIFGERQPKAPQRASYFSSEVMAAPSSETSVHAEFPDVIRSQAERRLYERMESYIGMPNDEATRARMAADIERIMMQAMQSDNRGEHAPWNFYGNI